jgi:hypothetical protein
MLYIMIKLIHFEQPIVKLSQNIIGLINIAKFFYDIFLNYKIQQNNFNYQKALNSHYEILCFWKHHTYRNNLLQHD